MIGKALSLAAALALAATAARADTLGSRVWDLRFRKVR
jgi:hypothetical protein